MELLFEDLVSTESSQQEPNTALLNHELIKEQITRYRREKVELNDSPLDWWRANGSKYFALTTVAGKYMCVSGTSVPSERLFSTAGNLLNCKRSCLSSDNVDMILFLNKNMK